MSENLVLASLRSALLRESVVALLDDVDAQGMGG
jgi:hypothetical protein